MRCPKCGSTKFKKNGKRNGNQRYKCNVCNKEWSDSNGNEPLKNFDTSSYVEELNYSYVTDNVVTGEAPTLEDLLNKFNIDEEIWKVTNFKVNQWDVSAKEEVDG